MLVYVTWFRRLDIRFVQFIWLPRNITELVVTSSIRHEGY